MLDPSWRGAHATLGFEVFSSFTSPLTRYCDVLIQKQLVDCLLKIPQERLAVCSSATRWNESQSKALFVERKARILLHQNEDKAVLVDVQPGYVELFLPAAACLFRVNLAQLSMPCRALGAILQVMWNKNNIQDFALFDVLDVDLKGFQLSLRPKAMPGATQAPPVAMHMPTIMKPLPPRRVEAQGAVLKTLPTAPTSDKDGGDESEEEQATEGETKEDETKEDAKNEHDDGKGNDNDASLLLDKDPLALLDRFSCDLAHPKCRLKASINNLCVFFARISRTNNVPVLRAWCVPADKALTRIEHLPDHAEQQELWRMIAHLLPGMRKSVNVDFSSLIRRIEVGQKSSELPRAVEPTAWLSKTALDCLQRGVTDCYNSLLPSSEELTQKETCRSRLEIILRSHFGSLVRLEVFGSAASGLAWKHSDIDLCVLTEHLEELDSVVEKLLAVDPEPNPSSESEEEPKPEAKEEEPKSEEKEEEPKPEGQEEESKSEKKEEEPKPERREEKVRTREQRMVQSLEVIFKMAEEVTVKLTLPDAKVPIIKITDTRLNLDCDICVNRHLPIANTKLLAFYASLDPRVRPLIISVKFWAKQRKLCDTYHGTLSAYAYVLMAINFLQQLTPPVLPCLQDPKLVANGWKQEPVVLDDLKVDLSFCASREQALEQLGGVVNAMTLAELVAGFFLFYGRKFDYQNHVVSVRNGKIANKAELMLLRKAAAAESSKKVTFGPSWRLFIEDPFELEHDLGSVIFSKEAQERLVDEFRRAYTCMSSLKAPEEFVEKVCEPSNLPTLERPCYKCGQCDHSADKCSFKALSGVMFDKACYMCGETDHIFSSCPQRKKCFKCGIVGHVSKQCPKNQRPLRR